MAINFTFGNAFGNALSAAYQRALQEKLQMQSINAANERLAKELEARKNIAEMNNNAAYKRTLLTTGTQEKIAQGHDTTQTKIANINNAGALKRTELTTKSNEKIAEDRNKTMLKLPGVREKADENLWDYKYKHQFQSTQDYIDAVMGWEDEEKKIIDNMHINPSTIDGYNFLRKAKLNYLRSHMTSPLLFNVWRHTYNTHPVDVFKPGPTVKAGNTLEDINGMGDMGLPIQPTYNIDPNVKPRLNLASPSYFDWWGRF